MACKPPPKLHRPGDDSAAAGKCYRIGFTQTSEDTATRQFFDGLILNARVHDRALTAAQIVLDTDGDGVNDNVEADFGSNPLDAQSLPPQQTIAGKVTTTTGTAIAGSRFSSPRSRTPPAMARSPPPPTAMAITAGE